jgi:5,10-methylenetetrahydromethanopterin reductase
MAPPLTLSAAFATSLETPEHVRVAESLGYARAWAYDSPALYPDVWATLARAAERTDRIGLGPGVLVPNLRHPLTNAAAVATLEALAPGRVAVAVGTGFTGRAALGKKALPWAETRRYLDCLLALLRGERAEWDGEAVQLLHGTGAARPVDVPLVVAATGPKGHGHARDLGADGLFLTTPTDIPGGWDWTVSLQFGTVLGDDEPVGSARVLDAAGPGAAVVYHALYEAGGRALVARLPRGEAWCDSVESAEPAPSRHLAVHAGHLVALNDHDRHAVDGDSIATLGMARTADEWRRTIEAYAADGLTELAYQPAGADIPGELERFAAAAGL